MFSLQVRQYNGHTIYENRKNDRIQSGHSDPHQKVFCITFKLFFPGYIHLKATDPDHVLENEGSNHIY